MARASRRLLGIDLGASSGRAMLGCFDGERLTLDEIHRFPHEPVNLPSGLHWDTPLLFREIERSLGLTYPDPIDSVGVDAWGVDYGLLDRDGALVGLPHHYRDPRTRGMIERGLARLDPAAFYAETGCQTIAHNTAFQLISQEDSAALETARTMLHIPDLMSYWLSGEIASEATIASTSQLYNPLTADWSELAIQRLGLRRSLFREVQPAGTPRGVLRPAMLVDSHLSPHTQVIATAGHDTASAFVAVTSGPASLVVSSGTWSLIGIEVPAPIITEHARDANFTNEAGVDGTVRFLRNAAGMWLIEECRRSWAKQHVGIDQAELVELAEQARHVVAVIDPDDARFYPPGGMPGRIHDYCIETGQDAPQTYGEYARVILEGLALTYRRMAERVRDVTGRSVEAIHIVGGGARNRLHCQLAADASGLPVLAGPVEATAIGNIMTQALALGDVSSLTEIRDVIARSFERAQYEPAPDRAEWDHAYARFTALP